MSDQKRVVNNLMSGLVIAASTVSVYWLVRDFITPYVARLLDPDREKLEENQLKAQANLQRARRSRARNSRPIRPEPDRHRGEHVYGDGDADDSDNDNYTHASEARHGGLHVDDLKLNEYEAQVALEVVASEDIPVGFDDIGGLEGIIEELKESIIYPLTMPHLYSHGGALLAAPSGVLLYGPPGCGKTMLAKAVARESGASFINLHISTLTEKWYGDSNKLVRAVFSLAGKLQPAIIFIDEIDAVLGTRRTGEHEASGMVKAEFMTLWDGLTSTNAAGVPMRIVVLGATNRIYDIDEAILRRMPKKFAVPLPDRAQRKRILQLVLGDTRRDPDDFDPDFLARVTAGMSGSDIKEACRDAAMMPMREYIRAQRAHGHPMDHRVDPTGVRGLRTDDFFARTGSSAGPLAAALPGPQREEPETRTESNEESRRSKKLHPLEERRRSIEELEDDEEGDANSA